MHSDNNHFQEPPFHASTQTRDGLEDMSAQDTILALGKLGLDVPLSSGNVYFNYYWLRDACPSTIDSATRERIFDISELAEKPYPRSAHLHDDILIIHWLNEPHITELPLYMLEEFAANGGRMADSAALPRKPWFANGYTQFLRVTQHDVENNSRARLRFARALIEDGIALVTDMGNTDEALTRLATSLGPVTPVVDGYYFDVQLKINPKNLAYTANALELHTDLPNEETAPGVQFLHCRANSVAGGRSLFVDGTAVAETLREEEPAYFELLSQHDVPFFRRHDGWDYRAHQRIIELDTLGHISGLTISQHLQDTLDLPQTLLDDYYPALCHFNRMLKQERFVTRFRLNSGECIVFDNHRVVHGREAYVADDGERHLRGCYVDRGALRSTFRTLHKNLT